MNEKKTKNHRALGGERLNHFQSPYLSLVVCHVEQAVHGTTGAHLPPPL